MFAVRFFVFFTIAVAFVGGKKENNVCPTIQDYDTIKTNKRCWYNPDVNAKPKAIARRHGFDLQNHEITTSDGYILSMYRVVNSNGTVGDAPVFMQHGICNNAAFWLLNGGTSLPLHLASVGFDVWLSNSRGTEPSMRHVNLSVADPEFWNFSFHEMAVLDTPALLDYVRKKTGERRKITFIGHSMGGSIQFVYASTLPDHAKQNVNAIISLAPVVYSKHLKAQLFKFISPYTDFIQQQLNMIDFHGSGMYPQLKKIVERLCCEYHYISLCRQFLESFSGTSEVNVEPEVLPLYFRRYPASFSTKTIVHYGQQFKSSRKFQMFDYGSDENLLRYNSVEPPEYEIEKINVPVYILYGEEDLLSVDEDNKQLFSDLKTEKHIVPFRGINNTGIFSHNDFLFSKSLKDLDLYLADVMRNISSRVESFIDINKEK